MKSKDFLNELFVFINKFSMKQKRKISIVLLILTASGIIYESAVYFLNRKAEKIENREAVNIETIYIKKSDHEIRFQSSGAVIYRDKATIASKVLGRAEKVFVRAGDKVRKGQLLARIETRMLELDLKSARAELQSAESGHRLSLEKVKKAEKNIEKEMKNITRAKADFRDKHAGLKNMESVYLKKQELFKAGGVADVELDSYKTKYISQQTAFISAKKGYEIQMVGFRDRDIIEYGMDIPHDKNKKPDVYKIINTGIERAEAESALNNIKIIRARIEKLDTSIKEANIVSPIDGVVAVRNVEAGEMIKESTDMFVIMNVDQIYVSVNVSEKQLGKIKKGQSAEFTSDGTGTEILKGRVDFISPLLDSETRSLEVKILAQNKNSLLKPGMFAKVSIITVKITDGIFIPKIVSVSENNLSYIFIIKNGTAFRQKVETGITSGDLIEITSGLKQGDVIAGGNVKFLTDGVKINAVK